MSILRQRIDRALSAIVAAVAWLALPLTLLLFLQWPLRDVIQHGSREANDVAQCLFAVYIAVAMTAATRAGSHLASDAFARRFSRRLRRGFLRVALLTGVLPWSLFVLVSALPQVFASVRGLEAFAETNNPGYFLVKAAVALLALCVLVQGVLALAGSDDTGPPA